jgi:hypothetical protein
MQKLILIGYKICNKLNKNIELDVNLPRTHVFQYVQVHYDIYDNKINFA